MEVMGCRFRKLDRTPQHHSSVVTPFDGMVLKNRSFQSHTFSTTLKTSKLLHTDVNKEEE
jgi:hypothetical protein